MIAMKKIVLFGAGGFGKEVAGIIQWINKIKPSYDVLGFVVGKKYFEKGKIINGLPLLGDENWILEHMKDVVCVCTIADPHPKAVIQRFLCEKGVKFETIISPTAVVSPLSIIGSGCVIYPHVAISPNVFIGDGVLLNAYVTVGHDVIIDKYTSVMPTTGISGNCVIGEEVSIGGHAFVLPGKKIGCNSVVAAGSIVFSNVKANTTVLGNPAKRMRELE